MGCDIHMYIEYSDKNPENSKKVWNNFGGEFGARNYELFCILADGIRGYHPKGLDIKGLPKDGLGDFTNDSLYFIIDPNGGIGTITLERAIEYNKLYGSEIINDDSGNPFLVEIPNNHSHSWLTIKEFKKALKIFGLKNVPIEYKAILAAMESIENDGYEVRTVFWFDS